MVAKNSAAQMIDALTAITGTVASAAKSSIVLTSSMPTLPSALKRHQEKVRLMMLQISQWTLHVT